MCPCRGARAQELGDVSDKGVWGEFGIGLLGEQSVPYSRDRQLLCQEAEEGSGYGRVAR